MQDLNIEAPLLALIIGLIISNVGEDSRLDEGLPAHGILY